MSLFGLSFGASSTKTKTTTNGTTVSTKTLPDWLQSAAQTQADLGTNLAGSDPNGFVAPAAPLQTQAAEAAAGLDDYSRGYGEAADLIRDAGQAGASGYQAATYDPQRYAATSYRGATGGPVAGATAASLLDNLDAYMSPYRREVVDTALADFDFSAGQTRALQDLDLAGSGAFGGSGAALTRSMTEDSLVRGRATTSANLRDQMFNRAAALANLDAERRNQVSLGNASAVNAAALSQAQLDQQAGLAQSRDVNEASRFAAEAANASRQVNAEAFNQAARFNATQTESALARRLDAGRGLADVFNSQGAARRANIETQAGLGATFRAIDQDRRRAPLEHASQVAAILSGLPFSSFGQETTTTNQIVKGKTKSLNFSAEASFPRA